MTRQLTRISKHLPRCIYVEAVHGRPWTFRDARDRVDRCRRSRRLDGPMDEWIFTNDLLAGRERNMYVDFVWNVEEHVGTWVTPAHFNDSSLGPSTSVPDLVVSLGATGCLSRYGLDVIADVWRGVELRDQTDWREVRERNTRVLERLYEADRLPESASQIDVDRVIDRWGLDLAEIQVAREELLAERDARPSWRTD
jgi:hypothetical protein